MTQEEILDYTKNCLILLDAYWCNDAPEVYPDGYWMSNRQDIDLPFLLEDMQFHSDWNWIMEVVENIDKLGFSTDSYSPNEIAKEGFYEFNIWNKNHETEGRGKTRKESYINAINKFLIWYEQNK